MGTRKRKNDDAIETDTDPIGKPKRKGKPKNEQQLANLILEGRSEDVRIVTVHADPPKKKKKLFKPYSEMTLWDKVKGCVFWVFAVLVFLMVTVPDSEKTNRDLPASNQVVDRVYNTPRPSSTPRPPVATVVRATATIDIGATMVAQAMSSPTATDVLFATNTQIPSMTAMNTPTPIPTNTPTPTQSGVRQMSDTGVVTGQSVRVRSCASTECQELGRLFNGVTFPITGSVSDGENIEGNRLWYQTTYDGQVGYVSATLAGLVSAQPVSTPVGQNVSPVQPTQPILVAPQWDCSGDRYNCDSPEFNTCNVIWSYFNTCPGDPSKLDGNNDGIPCNSRCG